MSTGCRMKSINTRLKKANLHPEHFNKKLAWVLGKEGIKHWGHGEYESWHPD